MRTTTVRLLVMGALFSAVVCAAELDTPAAYPAPILDNGPPRSEREEYDNKALGLLFHRTLFAEGDPQLAADLIMDPNFINHDVEEASGAQGFANFFLKPQEYSNPNPPAGGGKPHASPPAALLRLFVVTDGDLTMMAYPTREPDLDPGARFASNMFETKHGRVTQWWFSGPTQADMAPGAPRAAPPGPGRPPVAVDFSKWYPQMGDTLVSMQSVIPLGPATSRSQREANKALVWAFFDQFFNKKEYAAAERYLAADLKSHLASQPGGMSLAQYARQNPGKVTADKTDTMLFLLAQGELVDVGWPAPHNGDPGAWYAQNLLRVRGGKIVEWWYSGYPYGAPRQVNPYNRLGYSPSAEAAGRQ
jgi:predicted SnoaL-like aldol condensation-catalyzing enzyme